MAALLTLCSMLEADPSFLGVGGTSAVAALLAVCSMLGADSPQFGLVGTSMVTALLASCPVLEVDPSLYGIIGTSYAAAGNLSPMLTADSTLVGSICTFVVAALLPCFNLRPVFDTDSTLLSLVGASVVAALNLLVLCPMLETDSTLLSPVGAFVVAVLLVWHVLRTAALAALGRSLYLREALVTVCRVISRLSEAGKSAETKEKELSLANPGSNANGKKCFLCGSTEHMKYQCPKYKGD